MAETAGSEGSAGSASKQDLEVVLSKATDTFDLWQQVPAWVLGGAAILGGAALIAFPTHLPSAEARDAWAAVIVALFLAVLLSYRSALTLSRTGNGTGGADAARDPGSPGQVSQPGELAAGASRPADSSARQL